MTALRTEILVLLLLTGAGCGAPVPDRPTWFSDVQPLIAANCARCHGAEPYCDWLLEVPDRTRADVAQCEARLSHFRLDRLVKNDDATFDAWDYRDSIVEHTVELKPPAMPPDHALSVRQREILRRWVQQDAPKGTRDNRPPQAELIAPELPAPAADASFALTMRAWDDDGDGLWVEVRAREVGTTPFQVLAERLGAGRHELALDTGTLASGRTFEIYAVLDDGFSDDPAENATEAVLVPLLPVDHGARGTAPTVRLLAPNGGETLIGAASIEWSATDPDPGDSLTVDLDLEEIGADGKVQLAGSIARGLPNTPSSYAWSTASVPTSDAAGRPILYQVKITVRDSTVNVRSDASDAAFTVERGTTTTFGWADVRQTFSAYCVECHGQPAKTPALEPFRLDKYDRSDPAPPINGDDGVYERRGAVYKRMITDGTMPPRTEQQPSAGELARVKDWLLGGAPRGGAPVDQPPQFRWLTPNDTTITTTTSGNVTLSWQVSDPEGQPLQSGAISYATINGAPSCSPSTPGWMPLLSSVSAGSHVWSLPARGTYCLKAEVTDAASQTTVSVAQKPVRY